MTTDPLRLAVIIGSTRSGRIGRTVADWFVSRARTRDDLDVDLIDLLDTPLPRPARIAAADAVVLVTPEYNHGYPAPLKHAIDSLHSEWQGKPAGLVCYGGISGGLRAAEQLRQVLAELHMVTVRDTVSFHNVHEGFDELGEPLSPAGANAAAKVLLDQLTWWAHALRDARRARPYAS